MLTIKNIDKLLAINSRAAEVMKIVPYADFYKFVFKHDHLNSELIYVIHRNEFDTNKYQGNLMVDGGKQHRYDIETNSLTDPFMFLKFLDDMTYDWDVTTNK